MSIPNPFRPVCGATGYTPLPFVTFDGATAVDTMLPIETPCHFWVDYMCTISMTDSVLIGWRYNMQQNTRVGVGFFKENGTEFDNKLYFGRGVTFPKNAYRFIAGLQRHTTELSLTEQDVYMAYDGEPLHRLPDGQAEPSLVRDLPLKSDLTLYIGAGNLAGTPDLMWSGRVYGVRFFDSDGARIADIRPALRNGRTCLYDVVRKIELRTVTGQLL